MLSLGETVDGSPVTGRPGVRTHSLGAICLGAADRTRRRRAVLAELASAARGRGTYRASREVLTPLRSDPRSAVPLAFILARLLVSPRSATNLARASVAAYSLSAESIDAIG